MIQITAIKHRIKQLFGSECDKSHTCIRYKKYLYICNDGIGISEVGKVCDHWCKQ